jgi:multidrug efflux pump subunit AcrA (membrane-fusion protein)
MNFRFKAMQAMREPDQLDMPTMLARPRGWVATFVVLVVTLGAVVWAIVGRLPRTVAATGLLTHPRGVAQVQSLYAGQVRDVRVSAGGHVAANEVVAEVADAHGADRPVRSPFAGQVVSLDASAGQVIGVGASVLTVERTDGPNDRLVAMLFVPADQATGIRPGGAVDLSVSSAPAARFGVLRGRVASVGGVPMTSVELSGLLGGTLAVDTYVPGSAPKLVIVDLEKHAGTPSGYEWSTTRGFPGPLQSQVKVSGTVNLGSQSPMSYVLGR